MSKISKKTQLINFRVSSILVLLCVQKSQPQSHSFRFDKVLRASVTKMTVFCESFLCQFALGFLFACNSILKKQKDTRTRNREKLKYFIIRNKSISGSLSQVSTNKCIH